MVHLQSLGCSLCLKFRPSQLPVHDNSECENFELSITQLFYPELDLGKLIANWRGGNRVRAVATIGGAAPPGQISVGKSS